jgi:steroid 5-alpha reductase family enzyme
MWESFSNWFLSLGEAYGVNPFIFGGIYIGAIPFFSLSIAWLVRNYRKGKSIVLPAMSATFFFISAYIYLIFAGKNVPVWVYIVVVLLVVFGAYSTLKKVRRQINEVDSEKEMKENLTTDKHR